MNTPQNQKSDAAKIQRPAEEQAKLTQVSDNGEKYVYLVIESKGADGCIVIDILKTLSARDKATLSRSAINKIINSLLARKLIKNVKSIHSKTRKVYLANYISPSQNLVGNSFYSNGEFDLNTVNLLRRAIIIVLNSSPKPLSFDVICEKVMSTPTSRPMSENDIRTILRSLEMDQEILKYENPDQEPSWQICKWGMDDIEDCIEALPCLVCSVRDHCTKGALTWAEERVAEGSKISEFPHDFVSALNCKYISQWLRLESVDEDNP